MGRWVGSSTYPGQEVTRAAHARGASIFSSLSLSPFIVLPVVLEPLFPARPAENRGEEGEVDIHPAWTDLLATGCSFYSRAFLRPVFTDYFSFSLRGISSFFFFF